MARHAPLHSIIALSDELVKWEKAVRAAGVRVE